MFWITRERELFTEYVCTAHFHYSVSNTAAWSVALLF